MYATRHFQRALAVVALTGCASGNTTTLAGTWREPTAAPMHFQKILVAFATKDETLRRTVEDKLASRVPGSIPSYRAIQSGTQADSSSIRQQLAEEGFDGAVIMRIADVTNQATYVSGANWYGPAYGFGPYWGGAWAYPYDPGYVVEDKIVTVETEIYSLADDKLIWAGRSETTNPKSAGKLADAVIDRVVKALHTDGLLVRASCDHACATRNSRD